MMIKINFKNINLQLKIDKNDTHLINKPAKVKYLCNSIINSNFKDIH